MSLIGGRRRKVKHSRRRKGAGLGALLRQAALPGVLFAANQVSRKPRRSRRTHKHRGTRKGMVRKTARRAYMRGGVTRKH